MSEASAAASAAQALLPAVRNLHLSSEQASTSSAQPGREPSRGTNRGRGRGRRNDGSRVDRTAKATDQNLSGADGTPSSSSATGQEARKPNSKKKSRRGGGSKPSQSNGSAADVGESNATQQDNAPQPRVAARRQQFGGKLTGSSANAGGAPASSAQQGAKASQNGRAKKPAVKVPAVAEPVEYADLRSRLLAELSSGEYDCVICYSTVTTRQATWSCSQCYSVLHLPCVRKWADSSVKKAEEHNAMQEDPEIRNRRGTWRCPGCQYAREDVPKIYCDAAAGNALTAAPIRVIQDHVRRVPSRSLRNASAVPKPFQCAARRPQPRRRVSLLCINVAPLAVVFVARSWTAAAIHVRMPVIPANANLAASKWMRAATVASTPGRCAVETASPKTASTMRAQLASGAASTAMTSVGVPSIAVSTTARSPVMPVIHKGPPNPDVRQYVLKGVDLRSSVPRGLPPGTLSAMQGARVDALSMWRDKAEPNLPRTPAGRTRGTPGGAVLHRVPVAAPLWQASVQPPMLSPLLPGQEQVQETTHVGRAASSRSGRPARVLDPVLEAVALWFARVPNDVPPWSLSAVPAGEFRRADLPLWSHRPGATGAMWHAGAMQLPVRAAAAELWPSKDAARLPRRRALPSPCDALLNCGFHRCQGICHIAGQECPPCAQTCGKPRRLCQHACQEKCHAPSSCPETEPCQAIITLQCACGNLQSRIKCGVSIHAPNKEKSLKCNDSCMIAQRNAKLAEALGLNPSEKTAPASYEYGTLAYYAVPANRKFCDELEATLNDFIRSPRAGMILPPANKFQRAFTHELAAVYKLASESVDQEPRRSVSIRRKQDSRIPKPLLTEAFASARATLMSNQHQQSSSHLQSGKSVGLAQLQRPSAEAPKPLNAVFLPGVFGHDQDSLRSLLQPVLRTINFVVTWKGDEDVIVTSPDSPTRLIMMKTELKALLRREQFARDAILCTVDANKNVVRREDEPLLSNGGRASGGPTRASLAMKRGGPGAGGSGSGSAGLGKASPNLAGDRGWASVASGSGRNSPAQVNEPVWGQPTMAAQTNSVRTTAPIAGIVPNPNAPRPAATDVPAAAPATEASTVEGPVPESWEDES
ncbi:uncharacterized protein PAN0_011d4318 [Moesziomyces antarcticus]|uniref:R3H domain-containing protein n=1 Tax=Pseudozyma antarctica TaxID=84753 RepID=A0A081CHF0_PSEA2|nr:uncharacterized protein PAN0_011d4318 [Moesziomyces antarcticus]GAK66096.1 hypothetical protein PAN0_011d4318 [Moesziomyces antarcticus]